MTLKPYNTELSVKSRNLNQLLTFNDLLNYFFTKMYVKLIEVTMLTLCCYGNGVSGLVMACVTGDQGARDKNSNCEQNVGEKRYKII